MSELSLLIGTVKTALKRTQKHDDSVTINRDGSVRINLDSPEGRQRILDAAKSVENISLTDTVDK